MDGQTHSEFLLALKLCREGVAVYHVCRHFRRGSRDHSIRWICDTLGVKPRIEYTGGDRGWIGDSPFIFLDIKKIRSLGWSPKLSIRESVIKTVNFLQTNEWLFEVRE